ncbi:uncharacterized protein [Diabrotica undecimpunctata]|uniref:uncharacterized protein n=1 Tax=Diabrotica undecimpunctata TaxID=50387 RepID=UPI003B63273A
MYGREIIILATYGPTEDSPANEKERFIEQLQEEMDKRKPKQEIIIVGDLNGRVGRKDNDRTVGPLGEDTINDNGERLVELCEVNDLKIMNGFYKHKNIHKYTWTQETRKLRSIIDYIIMNHKSSIKVKDTRVKRGAECGTDHKLVVAWMEFPYIWTKQKHTSIVTTGTTINEKRLKLHLLQEESIKDLYKTRLDQKLEEFRYDMLDEMHEHIKTCLISAALEALGEDDQRNTHQNIKLREDTLKCIKEKKKLHIKYLNTKKQEDLDLYRAKNREVKKRVTNEKNERWEQACTEIERHIGGEIQEENIEHAGNGAYDQIEISLAEVKRAIKTLKNKKAKGPGGILNELIKNGTEKLFRMLHRMFERGLNGEEIPAEWTQAYITSILKKGNRKKCENYIGISIISSVGRLYGKIIKEKLLLLLLMALQPFVSLGLLNNVLPFCPVGYFPSPLPDVHGFKIPLYVV